MVRRWIASWKALLRQPPSRQSPTFAPPSTATGAIPDAIRTTGSLAVEGTAHGWLKVLTADELLRHLHAEAALDATWRQSRLAAAVWQRDLRTAIGRYAEFVQLMPASESHHHAHAGGLLAHTLEMVLAAMTWRNGHFLPSGAQIEQIDAERDVWTYVVFFAALLHDIAKPMTDLRIQWRTSRMGEPLRWMPLAGSLVQLAAGRAAAEYRVEFTPKSLRDYGAHGRLALTLLGQIAPASALSFLAGTPQAMDALMQYLAGHDKTSLVARIVGRADRASTSKALLAGSRARFDTATSVPLIELLMGALKTMLASGTALPLNRSGAAGWVYDGSIWFVAKRLADGVRVWLQEHAPDEAVPGDSKNDRLFDTWQEYGCIEPNPHTGQAVWYVVVQGAAGSESSEGGVGESEEGGEEGSYSHSLTVLRFPLARLYDDESRYPPSMAGRIEVKEKRARNDPKADAGQQACAETGNDPSEPTAEPMVRAATERDRQPKATACPAAPALRAPTFNKPRTGAASKAGATKHGATPVSATARPARNRPTDAGHDGPGDEPGAEDSRTLHNDDGLLDSDDDVQMLTVKPPRVPSKTPRDSAPAAPLPVASPAPNVRQDAPRRTSPTTAATPETPTTGVFRPLLDPGRAHQSEPASTELGPVVMTPKLPELPQPSTARKAEPSATALAFIHWLQQGLASQTIKYNEASAPVHFTPEGMALVSPLIFKLYADEANPELDADVQGLHVQREVLKAGWHRMTSAQGNGRLNILRYEVTGRAGAKVGKISAVVLAEPDRWVLPVPPSNPVLKLG